MRGLKHIAALNAVHADAGVRLKRLTALLKALKWARYDRRSEALDAEHYFFVMGNETGVAAIEAGLKVINRPVP